MSQKERAIAPYSILIGPVLLGLSLVLTLLAAFSLVVYLGIAGEGAIPFFAVGALCVGGISTAAWAAARAGRSRFLYALLSGAILFLVLAMISLAWTGAGLVWPRMALCGGVTALSACVGGLIGASLPIKHRKR